jgi:hypothetical protein
MMREQNAICNSFRGFFRAGVPLKKNEVATRNEGPSDFADAD